MSRLDKDFKREVDTEFKEGSYVLRKGLTRGILIFILLAVLCGGGGVLYTRTIGLQQKNAEREVFKNSIAYTEQAGKELAKARKEYLQADNQNEKNIIMNYIVERYPNLDTNTIDNKNLRQFYNKCLLGGE